MTTPDEVKRLADDYAHCYSFVGDDTMPRRKAELYAAIDAIAAQAVPAQPAALPEPVLQALRFYAHAEHYNIDRDRFDTVSGEPQNWLCSIVDDDSTMIEDGTIARIALRGELIEWIDSGNDEQPKPIAGEVFVASPQAAQPGQLVSVSSIDVERMLAECVPGGSSCDPQQVADAIRHYCNAQPSEPAKSKE